MTIGKKEFRKRFPLLMSIIISVAAGILLVFVWTMLMFDWSEMSSAYFIEDLYEILILVFFGGPLVGAFWVLPVILTLMEAKWLYHTWKKKELPKELCHIDLTVLFLGIIYNYLFLGALNGVSFGADWMVTLFNQEKHTPIFTESYPTLAVILIVAIGGYLIVSLIPVGKVPPLLFVFGMSGMYLGVLTSILFAVQVIKGEQWLEGYLLLLPMCTVFVTVRCVMEKIRQWNEMSQMKEEQSFISEEPESSYNKKNICKSFQTLLIRGEYWTLAAILLMWPLLGIIIGILMLFGQEPDAFIRAWTETSDWNLSQRIAPQNLYRDEHYLCTVAAGGHEKVVKPVRLGVRHGHEVIVNRQLCVANAFEQVLEEKTPRFHKLVRGAYDKYGFPVAKLIHSRWIADIIYIFMKPLEWMFLIVLYLVDANPENRIAVQYTGKTVEQVRNM